MYIYGGYSRIKKNNFGLEREIQWKNNRGSFKNNANSVKRGHYFDKTDTVSHF